MRLLIISVFPPMKAPEADHAFHLCEHLADYGLDVHVATAQESNILNCPGVTIHPIMRDWSWADLPRLAVLLKRCSPDAVILIYIGWIYNDHPMVTFLPSISKKLLPRAHFVTQFENSSGALVEGRGTRFTRAIRKGMALLVGKANVDYNYGTLLRDSDRIIVLSDLHRIYLSKLSRDVDDKSVLIPCPPIIHMHPERDGDVRERGREALGVQPNDFVIIYFGYIYPGKGIETLLRAFHLISSSRNNVRLVMVGGVHRQPLYAQKMDELSKQLCINDKIIWTGGYVSGSDEASVYLRAADLCVLPFDLGIYLNNSSFAAAAAHGLPIITTIGKIVELPFKDKENVLLCPPKKPELMAAAINSVINMPKLRQRLSRGALELAREWFSWDQAVRRTMEVFKGVQ